MLFNAISWEFVDDARRPGIRFVGHDFEEDQET